jgi:hypothetical protein
MTKDDQILNFQPVAHPNSLPKSFLKVKGPDGRHPRDWSPYPDGAARHRHLNHNRPISSTISLTRMDINDRQSTEPIRPLPTTADHGNTSAGLAATMINAWVKF